MRRREFIIGSAAAFPFSAGAQQPRRVVGVLLPYIQSESQAKARVAVFRTSLAERGWVGDRNVQFDFRFAEGQLHRLPALAADLVGANVDVIDGWERGHQSGAEG